MHGDAASNGDPWNARQPWRLGRRLSTSTANSTYGWHRRKSRFEHPEWMLRGRERLDYVLSKFVIESQFRGTAHRAIGNDLAGIRKPPKAVAENCPRSAHNESNWQSGAFLTLDPCFMSGMWLVCTTPKRHTPTPLPENRGFRVLWRRLR